MRGRTRLFTSAIVASAFVYGILPLPADPGGADEAPTPPPLQVVSATAVNATTPLGALNGIALADLDGDANLDIVRAGNAASAARMDVLYGAPDGTYGAPVTRALTGTGFGGLAIGDVNGDDRPDVVMGRQQNNGLAVALTDTLGQPGIISQTGGTTANTANIVMADFDGDDDLDVFSVNGFNGTFGRGHVFLGDGTGVFANPTELTVPGAPYDLATGDVDGDDDIDIVAGARGGNQAIVLVNNGLGTFTVSPGLNAGANVKRVALADFDNDTDLDLAVGTTGGCSSASPCLQLWRNNGTGAFTLTPADRVLVTGVEWYALSPSEQIVRDVDGDTHLDITLGGEENDIATIAYGNGAGGFTPRTVPTGVKDNFPFGVSPLGAVLAADVDGDDRTDLIAAHVSTNVSREVRVLGDPDDARGFQAPSLYPTGQSGTQGITLADIDSDTDLDAVVYAIGRVYVMANDGAGRFAPGVEVAYLVTPAVRSWCDPGQLIATDLDNDDDSDIVCVGGQGAAVALNTETPTWNADPLNPTSDGTYSGADTGDFDGDGIQEIVTWSWRGPTSLPNAQFDVWRFDSGLGNYVHDETIPLGDSEPSPQRGVAIADYNGDGDLDIAARVGADIRGPVGTPERLVVVPGNGDGTFGAHVTSAPGFPPAGQIEAIDTNYDDIVDLVMKGTSGYDSGNIAVATGIGNGTFNAAVDYNAFIGFSQELKMLDVNGDSLPDAIVKSDLAVTLLAAKADGTYAPQQDLVRVDPLESGMAIDDVDGDNRLDFVLLRNGSTLMVVGTNGTTAGGAADLVPTEFDGPEEIVAGTDANFTWTLRNDGNGAAHGPWVERITLIHPNGNTIAAEVRADSSVSIEPGASRPVAVTIKAPAATLGTGYQWRLDVNARAELPESNRANNAFIAAEPVTMDMQFLAREVITPVMLSNDLRGTTLWTLAPDDRPVSIDVIGDPGIAVDIYVGDGRVPSRTSYDYRNELGAGSLLLEPTGGAHTLYVRVDTRSALPAPVAVDLRARVVTVGSLGTVSPDRVGSGSVTFKVTGEAIGENPTVEFVNGATRIVATDLVYDGNAIWARADFAGAPEGSYDAEVTAVQLGAVTADADYEPTDIGVPALDGETAYQISTATLLDAVSHDPDLPAGRLDIRLATPAEVRVGRDFDMTVTYENAGFTDIESPILVLDAGSEPGVRMGLEGDPIRSNQNLQILAAPTTGPADRLRPGIVESVRATALAPRGAVFADIAVTLAVADEVSASGPDWGNVAVHAGISESSPLYADVVAAAETLLGPNWDGYADAIRAEARRGNATERVQRSVPRLIESAITRAMTEADGAVPISAEVREAAQFASLASGPRAAALPPGGVFPFDPPDTTVQSDYGDGDPRNWSRTRALTFWNYMNAIADAGSLNPISRDYGVSTSVFADHLDHFFNGDGSSRDYPVTDGFSQLLRNDPYVRDWSRGPFMQRKLNEIARQAAAGLECEDAVNISFSDEITAANNGIGLDFKTFNGAYGVGKIPRATITGTMTVFKDDKGGILYFGDQNVKLFDKYTWVYLAENDPYQQWTTGGFAIFEDKNFMSWYLEHYGIAKGFDITIELGTFDLQGTLPPGDCEAEPEPTPPPEKPPTKPPKRGPNVIRNIGATDPNDKQSSGSGEHGAIRPGDAIDYTIRFENIETATAPAQEVFVDDVLDANLDLSTLELTGMGFGPVAVSVPPGQQAFEALVDVPTDEYPVRITADLDPVTRKLSWVFRSEDPETLGLPAEASAGFLPPNDDTGRGEGWVSFRVHHVGELADGTTWNNNASIVFDVNDAIITNNAPVAIDTENPTATVAPLPAESVSPFEVEWSGSDSVGPVTPFDVYVSEDDGLWQLWLDDTTETSADYSGDVGTTYGFAAVGTDAVGRASAAPSEPDTETTVTDEGGPTTTTSTSTTTVAPTTTTTTAPTTTTTTGSAPTTTSSPPSGPAPTTGTVAPSIVGDPDEVTGAVVLGANGGVFALGGASFHGSLAGYDVVGTPVALSRTPSGAGYVAVTDRGAVYTFGDAPFAGSLAGIRLRSPIVDVEITPSGKGYWLVGADGGVFAFGDAPYLGSLALLTLNAPVVDIFGTANGRGYTLIAGDGGVFTLGNAVFAGSLSHLTLNAPVVDAFVSDSGRGYTLIGADGGAFAVGDAQYFGSLGGRVPAVEVVAAVDQDGTGYLVLGADGTLHPFGVAPPAVTSALTGVLARSGPVDVG